MMEDKKPIKIKHKIDKDEDDGFAAFLKFSRETWKFRRPFAILFGILFAIWCFVFIIGGFFYSIHKGQTDFFLSCLPYFFYIACGFGSIFAFWYLGPIGEVYIFLMKYNPMEMSKGLASFAKKGFDVIMGKKE